MYIIVLRKKHSYNVPKSVK
uniref:Uncharacterized protein n=1 Tax=Amphimedon queenslandica TaxID=400682 RepID=A0A1X7VE29_AMPQE